MGDDRVGRSREVDAAGVELEQHRDHPDAAAASGIAQRLYLSRRTVEVHVRNILDELSL